MADNINILIQAILEKTTQANLEQELKKINEKLPSLDIKTNVNQIKTQFDGLTASVDKLKKITINTTDEHGKQIQVIQKLNVEKQEVISNELTITENLKAQQQMDNALLEAERNRRIELEKIEAAQAKAINKARDQKYKQDLKAEQEMNDALLATEQRRRREQEALELAQAKASNKAQIDNYKQQEAEKLKTIELEKQIALYKERFALQANGVERTYGTLVNKSALGGLRAEVNALSTATPDVTYKMKQMSMELGKIQDTAQSSSKALRLLQNDSDSFGTTLTKDLAKFSIWMIVATTFMTAVNSLKETYTIISDIDRGMAGLRQTLESTYESMGKVMDTKELNNIANQFIEVAKQYGVSMNDLFDGAKLVSRQYKDMGEIMAFTKAGTILQVIDNLNLVDSFKALESITNQYNMVAKDKTEAELYSMSITDKLSNVVHNAAISAKDLTDALQRSGSILNEMGTDLDHSIGLITAGVRATQLSGSQIGIALKSVAGSIKSGEATKELEKLGISIKDAAGNYRSLTAILEDLMIKSAGTTKSLDEVDKAISGGKYQFSKVMATLSDYSTYVQTVALSLNSAGSSHKYLAAQMDTISKRAEILKQQLVGLVNSAGEGGLTTVIKGLISGVTEFVKWLNSLTATNVVLVGGIASLIVVGLKWTSVVTSIKNITTAWASIQAVVNGLTFNWATLIVGAIGGLMVYAASTQIQTNKLNAQTEAEKKLAAEEQKRLGITQEQLNVYQSNFDMAKQSLEEDQKRLQFIQDMADKHQQLTEALSHTAKGTKEYQQLSENLQATEKATSLALDAEGKKRIEINKFTKQAYEDEVTALNYKVDQDKTLYESSLETAKEYTERALNLAKDRLEALKAETEAEKIAADAQAARLQKQADNYRTLASMGDIENQIPGSENWYAMLNHDKWLAKADELEKQAKEKASEANLRGIEEQQDKVAKLSGDLAKYLSALNPNKVGVWDNKEPLGEDSKKSARSYSDPTQSLINQINLQAKLTNEKSKQIQKDIEQANKIKDYNTVLQKTNELIQNQLLHIEQLQKANKELGGAPYQEIVDRYGFSYDQIESWFDNAGEGTKKYLDDLNSVGNETKSKMEDAFNAVQKLKKAWHENANAINQSRQSIEDLNQSIIQTRTEIAENIIKVIKDTYKQEKELFDAKIENQLKKEQDRHDLIMSHYDDELRAIEQQASNEDYQRNLQALQSEAQDIQNQLNILYGNNDVDSNLKRLDLQKQLTEKQNQIQEAQHKHETDLRKQNIENLKRTEDTKYNTLKRSLDDQKRAEDLHFENLINDEQYYANIRKNIISGNVDEIKNKLNGFLEDFKKTNEQTANQLNIPWQNILNTISQIKQAQATLSGTAVASNTSSSGSINYNGHMTSGLQTVIGNPEDIEEAQKAAFKAGRSTDFEFVIIKNGDAAASGFAKPGSIVLGGDKVISNAGQGKRVYGDTKEDTLNEFKKEVGGFATGGINDVPGLYPLHGTSQSAETIFNATDSKKLWDYIHNLPNNLMNRFTPKFNAPSFSSVANGSNNGGVIIHNEITFSGVGNGFTQKDLNMISDYITNRSVTGLKKLGYSPTFG